MRRRPPGSTQGSSSAASDGYKRQARAFACRPTILFADEPTGNLDTGTGQIINDLLFDLNREEGTTLVLVTHEMNLAARCNRTLQLHAGREASAENASEMVR